MTKTNWQDPGTSEIRSTHISGLQEAVGKLEDSIGLDAVHEINVPLTEVFISNDDRCRIYQAPEGKRNWLLSPTPVIKKNGTIITNDFEIDYGGGAIIFTNRISEKDTVTTDVTYTINKTVGLYSPPITTHDNIISLPDNTTNGQVNLELKGETRTNLVDNGVDNSNWLGGGSVDKDGIIISATSENAYIHNVRLKPNTKYTIILDVIFKKGTADIRMNDDYTGSYWIVASVVGKAKKTFTTKSDLTSTTLMLFCNNSTEGNIKFNNVMILEGDYTNKDINFIEGTKSAIGSTRIRSVGKNLFDKNNPYEKWSSRGDFDVIPISNGFKLKTTEPSTFNYYRFNINLKPHTKYTIKANADVIKGTNVNVGIIRLKNSITREFIASMHEGTFTFTTDSAGKYQLIFLCSWETLEESEVNFTNIQLEEGNTATEYEPYKSDTSYLVTKYDDDKIVNLRSLPNGTKDEVNVTTGKVIIKNSQVILDGNLGWSNLITSDVNTYTVSLNNWSVNNNALTNTKKSLYAIQNNVYFPQTHSAVDEEGIWLHSDERLYLSIFKTKIDSMIGSTITEKFKAYLNQYPITLIYQLAEPEIMSLRWTGLNVEKNGTLYFDTIIPEIGFYYDNGLYSHTVNHPIEKVDKLYKIDKQTGIRTLLDTSKCEFREDRLSFTHPDLQNGDLCDWDYVPEGQYPNTEKAIIVPTNFKASVDSLLKDSQIQKENIRQFDSRLNGLATNIEENYVRFPCYVEKVTTSKAINGEPIVKLYLPNTIRDYKEGQRFTFKMPVDIEADKIYMMLADVSRYCYLIRNQDYEPVTKLYKKVTYTATYSGDVFIIQGVKNINFYKKTYAELKVLKNNNELVEGKKYLLIDYQTKYQQPTSNIIKTMGVEELVLTASSVNTFEPIVYSPEFPHDVIYFNFNDNTCEDGSTARNGFITYRIDTVNNLHCPQDWRTMLWYCLGGEHKTFGNGCHDIYVGTTNGLHENIFGNDCSYISFGNNCENNSFNEKCTNNSLMNSCSGNTFGDGCNNLFVKKLRNKDISNISELKNESCTVNIERNSNRNYIYWYFDSNNDISAHEIP